MKLRPRGLVLSDGRSYLSAERVSENLPALNQRFGETLQENRSRLVDARMIPLAVSQCNSDIILHRVTDGRTEARNALLRHADAASVRKALKKFEARGLLGVTHRKGRCADDSWYQLPNQYTLFPGRALEWSKKPSTGKSTPRATGKSALQYQSASLPKNMRLSVSRRQRKPITGPP